MISIVHLISFLKDKNDIISLKELIIMFIILKILKRKSKIFFILYKEKDSNEFETFMRYNMILYFKNELFIIKFNI